MDTSSTHRSHKSPGDAGEKKAHKHHHSKSHSHRHKEGEAASSSSTPLPKGTFTAPPTRTPAEPDEDYDANRTRVEALCASYPNNVCNDCNENGTRWASVNHGVFVCIRCSGVHRSLGVHVSKVKSTNMDHWTRAEVELMEAIGNTRGKALYESRLPSGVRPLTGRESEDEIHRFIVRKYTDKAFAVENVSRVLHKVYKQVGYGGAKRKADHTEAADANATELAAGESASGEKKPKVDREAAMRALYGDSASQMMTKKGKTQALKKAKVIHGTFGIVNVPEDDYDARLAAVLKAFGVVMADEPAESEKKEEEAPVEAAQGAGPSSDGVAATTAAAGTTENAEAVVPPAEGIDAAQTGKEEEEATATVE